MDQLGLWKLRWPELEPPDSITSGAGEEIPDFNSVVPATGSGSKSSGSTSKPNVDMKLPAAFRLGSSAVHRPAAPERSGKAAGVTTSDEFLAKWNQAQQPGPGNGQPETTSQGGNLNMMNMMAMQSMMAQFMGMQSQGSQQASGSGQTWEDTDSADRRRPPYQTFEKSILSAVQDGVGSGASQDGWENSLEEDNRYMGYIRDFNESGGFGFIECPVARGKYGMDVWIHRRQMFGFKIGEEVSFMVTRNHNGQPQARHVIKASDVPKIKAKKKLQEERTELQLRQKKTGSMQEGGARSGVMSEEEARRFQASLKRKRP